MFAESLGERGLERRCAKDERGRGATVPRPQCYALTAEPDRVRRRHRDVARTVFVLHLNRFYAPSFRQRPRLAGGVVEPI